MSRSAIEITLGAPRVRRRRVGPFLVSDASFAPGHRIPSHFHEWACVSVITAGRFVQRFPGRECDCPPGGVIGKPAGERHEDRWLDARSRHVIIELEDAAADLGPCAAIVERVSHAVDPVAETIARQVQAEMILDDDAAPLAIEGLVLELFAHLVRAERSRPGRRDPPEWLLRVRDLLHDRFAETAGLAELASEAGVHPSHLSRTFARHFGCPVGTYLRRLRLEAAKRALAHTDRSLSRIALESGFTDQSHLTRCMRKVLDQTPGQYRRRHGWAGHPSPGDAPSGAEDTPPDRAPE